MNDLYLSISAFIRGQSENSFDDLLVRLFAYQYLSNLPYRRLCDCEGITPNNLASIAQIPAVPARAFSTFDLTCTPVSSCAAVFHSSGTTSLTSSRHLMDGDALRLYELSLATNFNHWFPAPGRLWAVMPPPAEAPHSSLSHMLGTLGALRFAGLDLAEFVDDLRHAAESSVPITLFGTAIGLLELLSIDRISLPERSVVIETGGFKGRKQQIPRSEFYGLLREAFRLVDQDCYSEYGMCELGSQFYSRGEQGSLTGPRWLKTRCIDPITRSDAANGAPGLLRHYDLSNLNSVAVVQTQDRAVMDDDGGFRLLGRATDAELRGCSLTAEELWSA